MDELIININKLPEDLINVIKEFIPLHIFVFIDKTHYILYHSVIKKYICNYENYIRDVIKRDNDFVFERIVNENESKWVKITNYLYKNMIFKNYAYFVINYCIENDSISCIKIMNVFLKKLGLCKNLHKKNIIKYIR